MPKQRHCKGPLDTERAGHDWPTTATNSKLPAAPSWRFQAEWSGSRRFILHPSCPLAAVNLTAFGQPHSCGRFEMVCVGSFHPVAFAEHVRRRATLVTGPVGLRRWHPSILLSAKDGCAISYKRDRPRMDRIDDNAAGIHPCPIKARCQGLHRISQWRSSQMPVPWRTNSPPHSSDIASLLRFLLRCAPFVPPASMVRQF